MDSFSSSPNCPTVPPAISETAGPFKDGEQSERGHEELCRKQQISKAKEKCKEKASEEQTSQEKLPKETDKKLRQVTLHRLKNITNERSFFKKGSREKYKGSNDIIQDN